jgi:hypothetical protein
MREVTQPINTVWIMDKNSRRSLYVAGCQTAQCHGVDGDSRRALRHGRFSLLEVLSFALPFGVHLMVGQVGQDLVVLMLEIEPE